MTAVAETQTPDRQHMIRAKRIEGPGEEIVPVLVGISSSYMCNKGFGGKKYQVTIQTARLENDTVIGLIQTRRFVDGGRTEISYYRQKAGSETYYTCGSLENLLSEWREENGGRAARVSRIETGREYNVRQTFGLGRRETSLGEYIINERTRIRVNGKTDTHVSFKWLCHIPYTGRNLTGLSDSLPRETFETLVREKLVHETP